MPTACYFLGAAYCLFSNGHASVFGQPADVDSQPDAIQPGIVQESTNANSLAGASDSSVAVSVAAAIDEDLSQWHYSAEIELPEGNSTPAVSVQNADLIDFFVTADVFSHAAPNLVDLRIYNSSGQMVPYALRILVPKSVRDTVPTQEFNRTEPENGVHELTLDLNRDDIDHNEVIIDTSGTSFRRAVVIEGSSDARDWRPLASGNVVRFPAGNEPFQIQSFTYDNSRHRYVRIQISPDPQAGDTRNGNDAFSIVDVQTLQHVEVPGETVTTNAVLGSREPTRQYGVPASRWIVDLGGDNIPFNRLEADVEDAEFARDASLEAEYVNSQGSRSFSSMGVAGTWQRVSGDPAVPMVLEIYEQSSKRLRLTVADYRNKPLTLKAIRVSSPARQIVFERPAESELPLRLYFGNKEAEPANYDFARNLPEKLTSLPERATLKSIEENPQYVPTPKAFTERFPWLIYVALSTVSVVLGTVVVGLSRTAIANHDKAAGSVK